MRGSLLRTASRGSYRSYFLAIVLLVVGLLANVWCHVKKVAQGERIVQLREMKRTLLRERDHLRADVTGLKRSSRIREIAAIELGMRFPEESPNNLYVDPVAPGALRANRAGSRTLPRSEPAYSASANPNAN